MGEQLLPSVVTEAMKPSTWLDRSIAYLSPGWAKKRAKARGELSISAWMAGGYQGAQAGRAGTKGWDPFPGSASADLHPDLPDLRSRSRDLVRNSPLAAGALGSTVTSVVGTGLRVHPMIDRDYLGLTEQQADAWEREARRVFEMWAGSTNADIEGEQTFYQLQDLAFRSVLESGDMLRVFRFQEQPGEVFGTRIQLVEGDRVCNPNWMMDTEQISGGVEIDGFGRVIQYHVTDKHPGNLWGLHPSTWDPVRARGPSGRRMAQLMFFKTRPGQRRGAPFLSAVIEPLKQLERYSHAELMAAVVSGMFTVFVKTDSATGLPNAVGTSVEPDDPNDIALGYGAVMDLRPGESIESAAPGRPNTSFDPFVLAVLRQIGVGLEIPYEVLIGHFQSSYSAARAAILKAWQAYRVRRHWLAKTFCQPAYETVMHEAVIRGAIEAPGFLDDPFVRHAFLRCAWSGDAMPQIDPLKEINAAKVRVDMGVSTLQQETSQITGGNWEENHQQRVKESRMRREDGLDVESVAEKVVSESESRAIGPSEDPDEDDRREQEEAGS